MNNIKNRFLAIFTCLAVSACTAIQPHPENKPVRLIFYNELNIATKNKTPECEYLGPLVSSEGHWYDYLFISNTNLTYGAINDMKNKANEIGANLIYINRHIDFRTSVTLLGQAYACKMDNDL